MSEEGVGLPRETADLRGSPGNFRGSQGNFRGSLGNFRGTSGLLFSSTVRELPGKSPKTSGEVRETSGEVRGLPRSLGEPDSLPVTRQICLQKSNFFGGISRDFAGISRRRAKSQRKKEFVLKFFGEIQRGLAKGGLARKAPIGPKRALSGQFLLFPRGCGVRRNWSRSAPKRPR